MDNLSDNYFLLNKIPPSGRKQAWYLEKAFELARIPNDDNGHDSSDDGSDDGSDGYFDLDTLIISLKEKIVTEFNSVKYHMLLFLFKTTVVSLSHGNSVPKNGFAISKLIFGCHGNSPYKLIQLNH